MASRGARTSRGRGQRQRPAINAREIEETTEPKVGLSLTPMERARPFLLMKVKSDLRQTTSDWTDRCSDRLPSETHVKELRKSFAANVANKAVGDQILCGIPAMEFDTRFPPANRTAIWRATHCPNDDPNAQYTQVDRSGRPQTELLAGQHRKQALMKHHPEATWDTNLWWIVNVYEPPQLMISWVPRIMQTRPRFRTHFARH